MKLGVGGKGIRVGGLDSFGDSRLVRSVHHAQSTDNQLLRNDTSQQADVHLPAESERIQSRRDSLAELADVRMFLLILSSFVGAREVTQAPDHDGADQNRGRHLLKILLAFLPGVAPDGLAGRHPVRRQLHHEREVILLDETAQHDRRQNRQQDSEEVYS